MFIRAYLRASTEDQFADRAKEMLEQFVQDRGHKIASYYRENISGTKLDRPELGRLLMDSHRNDILLVEQIDRLTRLSNSDWITLKKQIEQHELRMSVWMFQHHGKPCQTKILHYQIRLPAQ
ncbi:resolvase, N terminal domain protein [Escherichia coli MP021561.3]|nr:resolvase, N terminal domain protein [Escherichia coli MP021561.3]